MLILLKRPGDLPLREPGPRERDNEKSIMNCNLVRSQEIYNEAVAQFRPYAVVLMLSGGNDSITAAEVTRALRLPVDFVLHGVTGTGIQETLEFVRRVGPTYGARYIEANAGDAYEQYVIRKGFFGRGRMAHTYAYHILKHQRFAGAISRHIRQHKRGRNIILLNGARLAESENRKHNLSQVFNPDPSTASTIWVNLIHPWSKQDCEVFLADQKSHANPVTQKLCRSGECLCGTMQDKATAIEAAFYFPRWGEWLDGVRQRVFAAGHTWDWGEDVPKRVAQEKAGQIAIPFPDFQPACVRCLVGSE